MTSTLQTQEALQNTAQDLRALGSAAKADLQRFQQDAQEIARTKVIEPGVRFVKDTSHRIEDQARRSATAAKAGLDGACNYVAENPSRALLGALAGGIVLGLLMRR